MKVIADLLAGRRVEPAVLARIDPAELCREADRHGVLPLVDERIGSQGEVPAALAGSLRKHAQGHLAADMAREAALRQLLDALGGAGVTALLVKGAMLAYSHYPRPDLRPRLDTDLLIGEADRSTAEAVLRGLGYEPDLQAGTDMIQYQRPYVLTRADTRVHVVDLHWRLVNPQVFRGVFAYGEMAAEAVVLPALGPSARGVSPVQALAVACIHPVAHHLRDERLIWLYDIHLIAQGLRDDEWRRFGSLAVERQVVAVCRASLSRAADLFGTVVPDGLWAETGAAGGVVVERSGRYLQPFRRHAEVVLDDLRATPGWRGRWRMMRAHVFPPAAYMRQVYAPSSPRPLLWLYLRRAFLGASKWLRRPS